MKIVFQSILAFFARAIIRRYRPKIIAVTGSVGKTSTKDAIYAVLKNRYRVRRSEKSLNSEIGLPLAILDAENHYHSVLGWMGEIFKIFRKVIFGFDYPEILVLEYGIQKPGDMDYLLSIAKPNIVVVTAIGGVPVHVEFFAGPEEIAREKAKLVAVLPENGTAVLNLDDYIVYDMRDRTKAGAITFGVDEHASIRITNYMFFHSKDKRVGDIPAGIAFKLEFNGSVVPVKLRDTFGFPQAYAAAAAAAVGIRFGMNMVEIAEALRGYQPPPGRMRLIKGIKNSFILDDSYNAAPDAMRSALDTLRELPAHRKIAVLGDMLEIGKYTEQVHRAVGDQAASFADILFTAGPRAKFIADEARLQGLGEVHSFDDSVSAGKALDPMIGEGDLILIKGSQGMRMEKAVEEIMAHPEKAAELLVRQDEFWKK